MSSEIQLLEDRTMLSGFYTERTAFMADPDVGFTKSINFDSEAVGTDFTNQTIAGVRFEAPGDGPLLVMQGATGIRAILSPTTGANVLSPGGNDTSLENDDLTLVFETPVQAAGIDLIVDVPSGATRITFLDDAGNTLSTFDRTAILTTDFQFVGYVSEIPNIKTVVFDEFKLSRCAAGIV